MSKTRNAQSQCKLCIVKISSTLTLDLSGLHFAQSHVVNCGDLATTEPCRKGENNTAALWRVGNPLTWASRTNITNTGLLCYQKLYCCICVTMNIMQNLSIFSPHSNNTQSELILPIVSTLLSEVPIHSSWENFGDANIQFWCSEVNTSTPLIILHIPLLELDVKTIVPNRSMLPWKDVTAPISNVNASIETSLHCPQWSYWILSYPHLPHLVVLPHKQLLQTSIEQAKQSSITMLLVHNSSVDCFFPTPRKIPTNDYWPGNKRLTSCTLSTLLQPVPSITIFTIWCPWFILSLAGGGLVEGLASTFNQGHKKYTYDSLRKMV